MMRVSQRQRTLAGILKRVIVGPAFYPSSRGLSAIAELPVDYILKEHGACMLSPQNVT